MIKIERNGNGFKMRFAAPGTGMRPYSAFAVDAREINEAINHHYAADHTKGENPDLCPLCRLMARERRLGR